MKLIDTLSITILLFSAVCHVTASFFTSIEQMTKLVHTHANLVNKLKELIDSQRHLLIQAEQYIIFCINPLLLTLTPVLFCQSDP